MALGGVRAGALEMEGGAKSPPSIRFGEDIVQGGSECFKTMWSRMPQG